ncbi:MAG: PH domain-containing protein, partial [Verrucomicrobiota bacterium]
MDPAAADPAVEARIRQLERPDPRLLTYCSLTCLPFLLLPPVALILWLAHYFRCRTLRYRFDAEGISMSWGILFRREILLNYRRIQDIHLVSNVVERWLGLARIQLQTASGSATPEMTIEGILEFEALRDFLYARMRGTHGPAESPRGAGPAPVPGADAGTGRGSRASSDPGELAALLREIAAELRAVRTALPASMTPPPPPPVP